MDAQQSLAMVKAFLDRGHRHVDTAFMYTDGRSEEVIGGMNLPTTGISQAPERSKHTRRVLCAAAAAVSC